MSRAYTCVHIPPVRNVRDQHGVCIMPPNREYTRATRLGPRWFKSSHPLSHKSLSCVGAIFRRPYVLIVLQAKFMSHYQALRFLKRQQSFTLPKILNWYGVLHFFFYKKVSNAKKESYWCTERSSKPQRLDQIPSLHLLNHSLRRRSIGRLLGDWPGKGISKERTRIKGESFESVRGKRVILKL